jgi:hypothetical protein
MAPDSRSDRSMKALRGEIVGASDSQILRIVATVDAMVARGPADALIAPLRQRLSMLRPPRRLRFGRLLFHPLDSLIVAAPRWRPGEDAIPRTALVAMTEHIRRAMPGQADAIEHETVGHTEGETDLVTRLGRAIWPAAAGICRSEALPETWYRSGLTDTMYRPLASCIAALLDEAASLEAVCAETANGLLPVNEEAVTAILERVANANQAALPMLIALLLMRLPEVATKLLAMAAGSRGAPMKAAMERVVDRVLQQLNLEGGTEDLITIGTLADAGAAASHIKTLLSQLDTPSNKPLRREQLRMIRQRLGASCQARFTAGLEGELLGPLQHLADCPDDAAIRGLETAARGLRVLEIEGRGVGSGSAYDVLLRRATEAIRGSVVGSQLAIVDQIRLVELLSGPEAALEMLVTAG